MCPLQAYIQESTLTLHHCFRGFFGVFLQLVKTVQGERESNAGSIVKK